MTVEFPLARTARGHLAITDRQFRGAWDRFVLRHRNELQPGPLPILAGDTSVDEAIRCGRDHGFDMLCREIVGACHSDMRQVTDDFFRRNSHIVRRIRRGAINLRTGRAVDGVELL